LGDEDSQVSTRVCSNCQEEKPLTSEFWHQFNKRSKRLSKTCKYCRDEKYGGRRKRNRKKATERNRKWLEANPGKKAEIDAKYRGTHSNEIEARRAVNKAIKKGDFRPVITCVCEDCQEKQAQEYHHESYATENWLDVVALCILCHNARHKQKS
jgi:hypothetical protein